MAKVKLALDSLSQLELADKARAIVKALTGNATFPDPNPALSEITALAKQLDDDRLDAETKRKIAEAATAKAGETEATLTAQLSLLGSFVEDTSGGNPEEIKSAGMDVAKEREPAKPLPAPEGFGASYGDSPGEIDAHWNPLEGRRSYEIQHAETETGPWTNAPGVTKSKATLEGLVSGKLYYLRIRGLNPAGPGAWSGVISQRAS